MRHRNTVLYEVLNFMPWPAFDRLVLRCDGDKHVRTLSTKTQFIALAYGQLAGAAGLRETITALNSHEAQLYHLGARPVARSTLSDANARRPSTIFQTLFTMVMAPAHRYLRQELTEGHGDSLVTKTSLESPNGVVRALMWQDHNAAGARMQKHQEVRPCQETRTAEVPARWLWWARTAAASRHCSRR